jgi:Superinfection immunity protein
MNNVKTKWDTLATPLKILAIGLSIAIALIVAIKVLPALVAAMGIGLLLIVLFIPYWIPTIIAFVRKHPSKVAILALNFFFGWSFIGWVASLVWALSNTARATPQAVVVQTTVNPTFVVGNTLTAAPVLPQVEVADALNGHHDPVLTGKPEQVPYPAATIAPVAVQNPDN